ncbi:phage tail length tape measure family protein [Pseudomonas benzopyrenica]|uniref:Phage tail length tape measure family protein n=1 Tax=Pseudomonas benzopyrenica TaxID=2993566 RepID=A0ABZ2FYL2_9PSED
MSGPSIAQLGIRVNSEEADQASDALDKLVQSGARTAQEMAALNLKQREAAKSAGDTARAMGEVAQSANRANAELAALNLKQQYAAQVLGDLAKSSGLTVTELRELNAQQRQTAQLLQNLGTVVGQSTAEIRAMTFSLQAVAAQNQAVATTAPKTTRAIKEQGDQVARLLGQIDPTVAALDRLDAQQRKLQSFKKSGLIDADTFDQYNSRLEQTRAGLGSFDTQLDRTGMSAKATAAAMRGVPAQLTDIVVSLQAGQAPLTVLLQQGGQLKDMFGGVGPAAKALGGYVLGLVNPFTLAAAAVAVLGVAYYQGSEEATRYSKAIILTGNAAGISTDQMADMAASISRTTGTTGQASEALVLLAESAKIPASQFEIIGRAAVAFSSATGRAIEDVIGEFVRLADEPSKAAATLNEKYRFLTLAVYEQIKALEEQGNKQEAARVAEEAYAKALTERSAEIKRNLGGIESAWASLGNMAKTAWDSMLNIGRPDTMQDKINNLKKQIAELESVTSSTGGLQASREDAKRKVQIEQLRAQLVLAEQQRDTEDAIAKARGVAADNQAKAIKASDDWSKREEANRSKEQRFADEEKKIRQDALLLGKSELEITNQVAAARAKIFGDARKAKAIALDTASVNQLQNNLKLIVGEYDSAEKKIEALGRAGLISQADVYQQRVTLLDQERGKVTEAYGAQIAAIEQLQGRANLSAQQRIQLTNQLNDAETARTKALADLDTKRATLQTEEEGRLRKLTLASNAYTASLQAQVEALRLQGERAAAAVGMGKDQAALFEQLNRLNDRYIEDLKALNRQRDEGSISAETYAKREQELRENQIALAKQVQDNYAQLQVAQADWANGARGAWQDYLSNARDVAGQTRSAFTDALKGMEDYLLSFITGTKASFKDLVKSIIADFARIELRKLISSAGGSGGSGGGIVGSISDLFGSFTTGGGSSGGGLNLASLYNYGSSAYNFITGTGANLWNAYSTGGFTGLYNYGASAVGNLLGNGAATVGANTIGATAGSTGYALGQNLVQGGVSGASYAGTGAAAGSTAANAGLSAIGAVGYGIGGAISGYQQAGVKGAVTGAGGAVAGAYAGAAIGSVIPIIGTAIGAAIGAFLGGTVGGSLWGGDWQTKDTGLMLGVSGGELDAQQYEYQKKKGGLFGKNKKRTRYSDLEEDNQNALDATYYAGLLGIENVYKQFGIDLTESAIDGLTVATTTFSTKDKTSEEVQGLINDWFNKTFDSITDQLNVATGSQFREGLTFSGLTSLLNNLVAVNTGLEQINVTTLKLSPASAYAADALRQFAGGMEQFGANVNTYYQGFFSQTEREDDALGALRKQFEAFNLVLPDTREQYRKLVESMDVTYDAGQKTLSFLLGQAGSAASAYDVLERRAKEAADAQQALADAQAEAAKSAADAAAKQLEAARQARISYADAMQQAYTADVQRAMSAITNAIKAEQDALTESYKAQADALSARISASSDAVSSLTSMTGGLSRALRDLLGQSDAATAMLYQQGRATLESAAAIAKAGGSLANFEGLDQALDAVTGNSADRYSNWEDFARDQGRAANLIDELNKAAGGQLSVEQRTLETLKAQLDQGKSTYDAQMKAFQGQIDLAQQQLDTLNGINGSVISVKDALAQFATALGAAYAGQKSQNEAGSTASLDSQISRIYSQLLGRNADAGGLDFWKQKVTSGALSAGDLQKAIAAGARDYISVYGIDAYRQQYGDNAAEAALKIPAFADGGLYSPGAALVGERGPEIINFTKPGYVHTAAETSRILGGSGSAEVVRELQALRQENRDMRMALSEIAKHTRGTRDELRQQNDTGVKLETA